MTRLTGELHALRTVKLPPGVMRQIRADIESRFLDRGAGDPRLPYRVAHGIELSVTQVDGRVVKYLVDPINLSKSGIAVLHGNFLYDNTPCVTRLVTTDGEFVSVGGCVVRNECISAPVHLLGIKFNQQVDIQDFVNPADLPANPKNSSQLAQPEKDSPTHAEESQGTGSSSNSDMENDLELLRNALSELGALIQAEADPAELQQEYSRISDKLGLHAANDQSEQTSADTPADPA